MRRSQSDKNQGAKEGIVGLKKKKPKKEISLLPSRTRKQVSVTEI